MGRLGWIAGALALAAAAGSAGTPQAAIAERRAGMHHAGELMQDLRAGILAGQDVAALAATARRVAEWSGQVLTWFPPGTATGDTNALPQIWSDRAGFEALAGALRETAGRMAAAARQSDRAAFTDAYLATADACSQCHRAFRLR